MDQTPKPASAMRNSERVGIQGLENSPLFNSIS